MGYFCIKLSTPTNVLVRYFNYIKKFILICLLNAFKPYFFIQKEKNISNSKSISTLKGPYDTTTTTTPCPFPFVGQRSRRRPRVMDPEEFLARFSVAFSWDYPDDWCLNDVIWSIFHIFDDQNARLQDQVVCNSLQSAGNGVHLTQPHPETDLIPCEMTFTAHPVSCEFCVTKIIVVSEARNVELYIDGMYEKTSKGVMLTLRKGKNAALYESEFDLSAHIQSTNKIMIKFVSMPDKQTLRLQSVMVKVTRCPNLPVSAGLQTVGSPFDAKSVEMGKVKEMMKTMGASIPNGAQQLMNQIEQHQQQGLQLQQLLSLGLGQAFSQFSIKAMDSTPSHQSYPKGPVTASVQKSRAQFEESFLANAILNTERSKQDTQKVMEDQARKAEQEAQINILKQILMITPQKEGQQHSSNERQCRNKSVHEGDNKESMYKQMLERLVADSTNNTTSLDLGTQLDGIDAFSPSQNRVSFRSSDCHSHIGSNAVSRPLSTCCSDISDRDFQRTSTNDTEDLHRKQCNAPLLPGGSKRCQECGCPGCLSVYNSITTNIYAMEERLLGRMDIKMQEISQYIDNKFEAFYDVFLSHQEKLASHLIDSLPRTSETKKPGKDSILHRTEGP